MNHPHESQAAAMARAGELPELPASLGIDWPSLNPHALGCGVEDRNIHDRYAAAEYGWQDGADMTMSCVPDEIYDADQMRAYARAALAAERAEVVRLRVALKGAYALVLNLNRTKGATKHD